MKKWYAEEFQFEITVLHIKPDNTPENHCRMGLEVGDKFICEYGCPKDFCCKTMLKVFPIMEAVRSRGDLRNLGGTNEHIMDFCCSDGIVEFRLEAKSLNDDQRR